MTGTTSNTSPIITVLSPVGAAPFPGVNFTPVVNQPVTGSGVPAGATILSVDSPTQVTLNVACTAGASGVLFNFGTEPVTLADAKLQAKVEYPDEDTYITSLITAARRQCETQLRQALATQSYIMYLDSFPLAGGYYNPYIRQQWASFSGNAFGGGGSGVGFYPGMFPNSTGVLDLPMSPLQSVQSVTYTDFNHNTQTVSSSVYKVALGVPGRIQPHFSQVWPIAVSEIDSIQITFTCGYGPNFSYFPENAKQFIKMLVAHWWANREAVQPGQFMTVPWGISNILAPDDPGVYA